MEHICGKVDVSQRRACRTLDIWRSSHRYPLKIPDDEEALTNSIINLATQYGRYGYRRITAMLKVEGWKVNHKRVERIWQLEGLKVPKKQPKRRRLWLNNGSCIRLRPEFRDHVWTYDFMFDRTSNGRPIKILNILDEYSRESLLIDVERKIDHDDVIQRLADLFINRGIPQYIRSDNGSEFIAKEVREWMQRLRVTTLFIEPGSPWENGYIESFNGKMRDELLNREVFDTLFEAKVLIERWRQEYNQIRPHSSLGYKPPAPEAILPKNYLTIHLNLLTL